MFDAPLDTLAALCSSLLSRLLYAALWGGLFALGVWMLTRFLPRLPAGIRCFLWWAVCAKFLVALVLPPMVELPLLPTPALATAPANRVPETAALVRVQGAPVVPTSGVHPPRVAASRQPFAAFVGVSVWWIVVAVGLLALAREAYRLRGLLRRAVVLEGGPLASRCAELAGRFELAHPPVVCLSPEVESPQAVGFARPRVVLPGPPVAKLSAAELDMTLGHELAHLRRGDLWLGWVPAVARRLFWFHPLAALAANEYVLAREAACDAEVLRVLGTAPQDYGRLLLRWGVVPRETGLAAAGAAPSLTSLRRRLQMLQQIAPANRRKSLLWGAGAVALVFAAWMPVRLVTAAPPPAPPAPPVAPVAAVPPVPPVPPVAPAAPVARVAPAPAAPPAVPAPAALPAVPPAPPAPPTPPTPPTPSAPPAPPAPVAFRLASLMSAAGLPEGTFGYNDPDAWVLFQQGQDAVMMNGSTADLKEARLMRQGNEGLLFFKREGSPFVVRDAALLAEIERLFEPVRRLGERQAEVGERQAAIGEHQAAIGERQGRIGGGQSEIGEKMSAIGDRMAQLASRYDDENAAGRTRLDGEMKTLGSEMETLGKQMETAHDRAMSQLQTLLDAAIRDGRASNQGC